VYTAWTNHLKTDEDKKSFAISVSRSKHVLNRLKSLIEQDLEATGKAEISLKAYDNLNWAYRQAHTNGYKKALTNLLTLVDLDKQKVIEKSDRLVDDPRNKPIITGPPEPGSYPELP
jgi:Cu2+-containing amine oxidase